MSLVSSALLVPETPAVGLCDYGLGSQPTDTPTEVNTGSVTCMVARSWLALYPGNRGWGETRLCLGVRLVKVEPLLKETWERGLKSGGFPLRGDPLVSNYITHNVSTCDQKMEAEMKADQETLKQPFT